MKKINSFKGTGLAVALSLFAVACIAVACDEFMSDADKGKEAANAFCNCLENDNSMNTCSERFHDKYGETFSDAFITAFNKAGKKCDIEANKK